MIDELIKPDIAGALSTQLSVKIQIKDAEKIQGGDINETWRLRTNAGAWFLKLNDARRYPDMFQREQDGLEELRQTGHIGVPQPVCHGKTGNRSFLITEYIEKSTAAPDFWECFAASIAKLHQETQPYFGLGAANYIGTIRQYNTPYSSWAVFYALNRLLPLGKMAYDQHRLDKQMMLQLEAVCKRLPELFPEEPPALLHGDLWSGNFLVGANGKAYIFDPAVYYGHREMDLAMTRLFGGFDTRFYYTYHAIRPLAPGWQQRIGLCQLYPLLVHLVLFGGNYYNEVKEVLAGA